MEYSQLNEIAESQSQASLGESFILEQIQQIDEKIAEIEASIKRLSDEEADILARRGNRISGDVDAIVAATRQQQMRFQELRDTIEIEQAPLAELKSRRADLARQYDALKRLKTQERIKQLLTMVDDMQQELSSVKAHLESLTDTLP